MRSERLRWRDVRSTAAFRLTLILGALFLAGLWATLGFSYLLTARELTARSDRILFARAGNLLAQAPGELPRRIRAEIRDAAPGYGYFALVGRNGAVVAGNIRLPATRTPGIPFNLEARGGEHGPLRVLAVRTRSGEMLVLGRDISQIRDLRGRLLLILVVSGVLGTVIIIFCAIALSVGPLRRVRDMERASKEIAAGDFARRMPLAGRHDELDQFAVTVNLMLDEVAHVVAQVKTATDAIAHDLRTPLTRVRALLHRARQSSDLSPQQADITDRALVDLDSVIERFGALLRISELEASGRRCGLRRIDPVPLLEQLIDLYQPLSDDRGISLTAVVEPMPLVEADPGLLFEAMSNLVDNAIKFARRRVQLIAVPGRLEVVDDGPGIPAEERGAVIRRFHRAKGASGVEGTGLGLAVVTAIMHLHGFTLELEDADPGLVARISMEQAAKP